MTNEELILAAGWQKMNLADYFKNHSAFEKGNYWLILDESHRWKDADNVTLMVRDPAKHDTDTGTDRTMHSFSFLFKGQETIDAIQTLIF